jgi:ubiquinone/menaquinone biosynthesis C-methylase UbiE
VNTDEYDFKLGDNTADFLLVCTVLHEFDDKPRFLSDCARICRPGGKLAVIEFDEANTDFGPPREHRLKKSEVIKLLEGAGFSIAEELKIGDAFFAVTALK